MLVWRASLAPPPSSFIRDSGFSRDLTAASLPGTLLESLSDDALCEENLRHIKLCNSAKTLLAVYTVKSTNQSVMHSHEITLNQNYFFNSKLFNNFRFLPSLLKLCEREEVN